MTRAAWRYRTRFHNRLRRALDLASLLMAGLCVAAGVAWAFGLHP